MNIKDKLLKIIKNKFFIIVCIIVILVTSYIIIEEMMVDNNNEIEIIEEADDIFKKDEKNEDLAKKYEETLVETLKKYLHVNKKVNEILNEEEGGDNNE